MLRWFAVYAMFVCLSPIRLMGAESLDTVIAQVSSSAFVITNQTEKPVCFEIHEANLLTRIEWAPECSDMNQIPPRKSVRVSFIPGDYRPSGEAVISWWFKGKNVVAGQTRLTTH